MDQQKFQNDKNGDVTEGTSPSRPRRTMPKSVRLGLIVTSTLGLLALTYWLADYLRYGRYQQSTNNAYIQTDEVVIAPKVTGYVEKVLVLENQAVGAGQPLVIVDARDYEFVVDKLKAETAAAQAAVTGAQGALREQEAQSELAQAQVLAAKTAVAYATGNATRYKSLAESGAETGERYDNARFDRDRAAAELNIRKASQLATEKRFPVLQEQLAQLVAQRDALNAQVSKAMNDIDATTIRSGIAGIVGSKTVREGQFIQPGQRLMTIVPVESFYVTANFKETQLSHMRVGQLAKVSIDAYGDIELQGVVQSLSPATGAQFSLLKPENATGNFTKIVQRLPVRIQLFTGPEAANLLKAGLSVEVSVDTRGGGRELKVLETESLKKAAEQ